MILAIDIVGPEDPGPGKAAWEDIGHLIERPTLAASRVAIIAQGMTSGRPSVMILAPRGDGYVAVELSDNQLHMIAAALRGASRRWGVPSP